MINKSILQVSVFLLVLTAASSVVAQEFRIKEMAGLVLVNTGEAFVTAKQDQVLRPGDQLYVLDRSAVVLAEEQGCFVKIGHNAIVTLKKQTLCEFSADAVKFTGTRYAAALGIVQPEDEAPAEPVNSQQGTVVVDEEPVAITESDTDPSADAPDSAGESIAAKLAVPATVLGAIGFSTLAGGGGILGGDSGNNEENDDPDTNPTGNGDSGDDPISPS